MWHYERWILILWKNQNYNYSNNKKSGQKSKVIPWVLLIWVRVFFKKKRATQWMQIKKPFRTQISNTKFHEKLVASKRGTCVWISVCVHLVYNINQVNICDFWPSQMVFHSSKWQSMIRVFLEFCLRERCLYFVLLA